MMTENLTKFDPAEYLADDVAVQEFMKEAFDTGDHKFIAKSLGVVARVRGMGQLAEDTGLSRETLYRSFGDKGNPTLKTLLAVAKALGVGITATAT